MSNLLSAAALCALVIVGLLEYRRVPPLPLPPGRRGVRGGSPPLAWAAPWLLSVNWNGDEGDKKSGGK